MGPDSVVRRTSTLRTDTLSRSGASTLEKWGVMADSRPPPAEHGERPLLRNREGAVRCLSCLLDCGCPDRWQFEI